MERREFIKLAVAISSGSGLFSFISAKGVREIQKPIGSVFDIPPYHPNCRCIDVPAYCKVLEFDIINKIGREPVKIIKKWELLEATFN